MSLPPSLKTAMTPFPYSVDVSAPVSDARRLMEEHNVHHLPVTAGRGLVGIITSRAVLVEKAGESRKTEPSVGDVQVEDVYVVDLDEPLDTVLLTMAERHVGSAVVTRKGKLAGVFTWVDACRSFGDYLRANFPHAEGDDVA